MKQQSEVARLRTMIEQEVLALQNLQRFTAKGQHAMVHRHYEALVKAQEEIEQHIGEEQATAMVIAMMDQHLLTPHNQHSQ